MSESGFKVGGLGEIAIRCINFEAMVSFYSDIIGLEPMRRFEVPGIVFFRVSEGYRGHTAVLALFRANENLEVRSGTTSSLHHIALSLGFAEQEQAMKWYERHEIKFNVEIFDWIGWRGIFTNDPDGNTVELVAYDPSWKPK